MSGEGSGLRVDPARAVLLVVDWQERLAQVMAEAERAAGERHVATLVETARRLGLPVVVSEQYKKGLGATVPALEVAFAAVPAADGRALALSRFEKLDFACTAAAAFAPIAQALAAAGRTQWLVTGMETHICVYQTARGLVESGASVQVVRDAVLSRSAENKALGLDLCERAGALVTATEVVVFDALARAGSDDFKALSKLIK